MSKGEVQYFLMFVVGIAAFWASGYAVGILPAMHGAMAVVAGVAATLLVYGLIFAVLELVLLGQNRAAKPVAVSAVIVMILAVVGAMLLQKVAAGHIHNKLDVGLLTFALYLLYGLFYVIGNTIARRLAN
jgi:hypothetical protein